MSEWIKVSDRLPQDEEMYLVITREDGWHLAWKPNIPNEMKEWYSIPNYFCEIQPLVGVTHWMPLPDHPIN